jgi:hypothetical protein
MEIIYQSKKYDPEKHAWIDGWAVPVFDSTDHFHFACYGCKEICIILRVDVKDYPETRTISFLMVCPKCGKCCIRKIHLNISDKDHLLYPVKVKSLLRIAKNASAGKIKCPTNGV